MIEWLKLPDAAQDEPNPQRALVPNRDYVIIEIASVFFGDQKGIPVIISEATLAGRHGEISIYRTITPEARGERRTPPRQQQIRTVLAGPVPYRGGDIALTLVAAWLPKNSCTEALLDLVSTMSAQAGVSVSDSIRSFARSLAEAQRHIGAAANQIEFSVRVVLTPPQTGAYVIVNGPRNDLAAVRLDRELYVERSSAFAAMPHAVLRVLAADRREDAHMVPDIASRREELTRAMMGGESEAAAKTLLLGLLISVGKSPDLTDADSKALVAAIHDHYKRLREFIILESTFPEKSAATPRDTPRAAPPAAAAVPEPADLTLVINAKKSAPAEQYWEIDSPHFGPGWKGARSGHVEGFPDALREMEALRGQISVFSPDLLRSELIDKGKALFDAAPEWFRAAYWKLQERKPDFSIQIYSNRHAAPLELMVPNDGTQHRDLLCLKHPVGRWCLKEDGSPPASIPFGEIAILAPNYTTEDRRLAEREQVMSLRSRFDAFDAGGALHDLLDLVTDPSHNVAVIHFFGHGEASAENGAFAQLCLEGKEIITHGAFRETEMTLGARCRSLVILNACSVATGTWSLGREASWPAALMAKEFGGVIAPLWPIMPAETATLTDKLLTRICDGQATIGSALRTLRSENKDLWRTALSYVYFGDVNARISLRPLDNAADAALATMR
jgi:hypothetical protein